MLLAAALLATSVQAAPAFQAAGNAQAGTGNVSPAWPAHQIEDVALLFVESSGGQAVTLSTPAGFAAVANSPQATGTGTAGTRITVFWARATSASMPTPTVADPGNHVYARILTYRGVVATGNPWDVTGGNTKASASTSVTVTGVTTTVPDTLIVQAVARHNDNAGAAFSAQTNANLTGIAERSDAGTTSGNGGGFAVWDGAMATAGPTGNTTATVTSSINAFLTIALKAGPPAPSLMSPADGATVLTATPTFDWTDVTDPGGGMLTYQIQADNSGCGFASPEMDQTGLAASIYTPGASLADGTYCWRVRAVDEQGNAGAWSTTRNVIVDANTFTSQTRSPTSAADCTSLGGPDADWSNQGNAASSNNQYATATVDGTVTDPLRCLNYAFSIPPNATIVGIVVSVERRSNRTQNGGSRDNTLFLVKGGSTVGANRATSTTYTTSDVVQAHGGASDLWGTTWTPAEINAADFGALFTATKPNAAGLAHVVSVDHIEITVHYTFPNVVTPGSFNAFETGTAANAITGSITTKIAGAAFSLDVVAISGGAQQAGFDGAVTVELLGNNTLGVALDANNCPTSSTTLQTVSPDPTISGGRSTVNFAAVPESWRDVRVRIRFPTAAPTVTSCSTDNFALRPSTLAALGAHDQDWQSAGVARTLDDITITAPGSGGKVHKAGRPFSVRATARNAAGATTTSYAGTPSVTASACAGAACTATVATLTLNPAFSLGQLATDVASYPDVGAFQLQLVDDSFASVDAVDTAADCTGRYVCSALVNVGRFVPDHFAVASAALTPRSDIVACGASTFTYLGERMDVQMSLEARAFGGALASRYDGTLARLDPTAAGAYSFGAIDSAAPTPLTGRLSVLPIAGAWAGGVATVTAPLAIERAAGPDGPFNATRIGIAPADPDGVTLASFDLDADNSGSNERLQVASTALRFGRLRLENAVGSERMDLPIPIQAQYWNAAAFQTNSADHCTSISAANVAFGNYFGGITAANMNGANVSGLGAAFASGVGSLTLTKPLPTPASPGAVTLTIDLSAEAKSYLKGNWGVPSFTADPAARAAFGLYGGQPGNFIYFRENY